MNNIYCLRAQTVCYMVGTCASSCVTACYLEKPKESSIVLVEDLFQIKWFLRPVSAIEI